MPSSAPGFRPRPSASTRCLVSQGGLAVTRLRHACRCLGRGFRPGWACRHATASQPARPPTATFPVAPRPCSAAEANSRDRRLPSAAVLTASPSTASLPTRRRIWSCAQAWRPTTAHGRHAHRRFPRHGRRTSASLTAKTACPPPWTPAGARTSRSTWPACTHTESALRTQAGSPCAEKGALISRRRGMCCSCALPCAPIAVRRAQCEQGCMCANLGGRARQSRPKTAREA